MSLSTAVQLGTTETTILTATAETAILSIIFYNSSATVKTVTLYLYPSGGSASATTTIAKFDISAYNTFSWSGDEKIIVDTGSIVSALADTTASVSVTAVYKAI